MTKAPAKKNVRVRIYRLRSKLKDKAGGLGKGGETGSLAAEALAAAEAEFQKMAEDYPDWVGGYITSLYTEYETAKPRAPDMRLPNFHRANQLAHELKGQGGTFGYPLITTFGKSLYDLTVGACGTSDNHLEILKAHIDAMQAVVKGRVKGEGGALGAELAKSLEAAIAKYSAASAAAQAAPAQG
ncbi:MAG TPA: hypothetical protein VMU42_17680 [Candidatus Sulfotelmatobacter sp.]|nr:hypothetical protein [Candidatus Sulfotelmatobacter sp.]